MGLIEILLGVVFTVSIGLGFGLGAMGDAGSVEFWIARGAFIIAAFAIAGAFFYWLSEGDRESRLIILFGAIVGAWVFIGLPFQLKWLDGRQEKIKALEAAATPAEEGSPSSESIQPNISFQKFALFWVKLVPSQYDYQLGVVTKLFNLDSKPYLINGIVFNRGAWQFVPRSSFHLRTYTEYPDHAEIIEDNYIKAGNEGYFKKLLPLTLGMDLQGPAPEAIIIAQWGLVFGKNIIRVNPELYSVYETPISPDEWDDLLKPKSQINIDNLHYKKLPARLP
jgi:hypothetical protein